MDFQHFFFFFFFFFLHWVLNHFFRRENKAIYSKICRFCPICVMSWHKICKFSSLLMRNGLYHSKGTCTNHMDKERGGRYILKTHYSNQRPSLGWNRNLVLVVYPNCVQKRCHTPGQKNRHPTPARPPWARGILSIKISHSGSPGDFNQTLFYGVKPSRQFWRARGWSSP